ncbi:ATP-binding cassette domain-containing protein, partial [Slackia exigua]|uniref:ATP-binding cassette domain-containing protein n=1 Tax=Slackia exigua TaxID=84109 RepID=UPI0028DC3BFD
MIEMQDVSFEYRAAFSGEEREDGLGRAKDGRGGSGKNDGSGRGGVRGLSLRIDRGECVLLCGASGCGKTTVARLVNGLIPHFFEGKIAGTVCVDGMDSQETEIAAFSDAVGTVFQNPRT